MEMSHESNTVPSVRITGEPEPLVAAEEGKELITRGENAHFRGVLGRRQKLK